MRRLLYLLLMFLLAVSACKHTDKNTHLNKHKPGDYQVKIKIPAEWIEKVRRFDYTRKTQPVLLHEFENIIKPDTIYNPHAQHVDEGYGRVFDPIFADIDGEFGEELVCMLGWDISCPNLCIFKEIKDDWYLIYFEAIDTFYSAPSLSIANNFSKNKVFYFDRVYNHGSDLFADGFSFYKLIDGRVYHCLELPNENHIYGWGLFLNQEISTSFSFSGDDSDCVGVQYNYNFFPGAVFKEDLPWQAHDEIPLVKGSGHASYKWNDKNKVYELKIENYQHGIDDLTAEKIACFNSFSNDTLFVKAFKRNIDTLSKIGTVQQKSLLKLYLAKVKKDKKAVTHEMKKTTSTGTLDFYSAEPKK